MNKGIYALVCVMAMGSGYFTNSYASEAGKDLIGLPQGTVEDSLSNGFKYIIYPNEFPSGRTEFRLVWKVGAVQQDDSQGGGAHFLEHMAFGGSKHFPNREAVGYLESLGMKYGIDVNAFTGHDRTIYMFAVPSDSLKAEGFRRPLDIIRDWMDQLEINKDRVETEKGIIQEELRTTVQEDPFYNLKIGQNRFSNRMPLGTPEEVGRMTASTLKDFYKKWYIPEFATLVVVGDVDTAVLEKEIKNRFGNLKRRKDPGFRRYSLDYNPRKQIMVDLDSLNAHDELEMIIPHPAMVVRTIDDARKKEMRAIAVNALSRRLSEVGIKGDVSDAWYLGDTNHLVFSMTETGDVPVDSCIALVSSRLREVLDKGFYPEEIKYEVEKSIKRIGKISRSGNSSSFWCEDFVDFVITGDRYISNPDDINKLQDALATVTADEVTETLRGMVKYLDSVLLVAVRSNPTRLKAITMESVEEAWKRGEAMAMEPYKFEIPIQSVMREIATPGILLKKHGSGKEEIRDKRDYASLGIREYRLKNGIKLVMRRTSDDGAAMFAMLGKGGYGSIETDKLPLLNGAAGYIDMGGIAKVQSDTLGDYLYQKGMSLSTTIENDWHGFLGAFETENSGEFFNLVYEKINDPELRYSDFEEIREGMLEDVGKESLLTKMLNRASDRQLMARMDELMCVSLPNPTDFGVESDRLEKQRENIRNMSLDSIAGFYKGLYANAKDKVFFIAGNFDQDKLAEEFASVFGKMDVREGDELRFSTLSLPTRQITERFATDNEGQTDFDYVYFGEYRPGLRNSLVLKIMSNILRNHVIAELRERRGLVYSPYVTLNYEGHPRGYFYFDINSSAESSKMPEVDSALKSVIDNLRREAVAQEEISSIARSCKIAKRETLTLYSPSAWRTTLLSLEKNGESLEDFDNYEEIIDSITADEVREAFESLINPDLYLLLYI